MSTNKNKQNDNTSDENQVTQKSDDTCVCRLCLQQVPLSTCTLLEGIKIDMLSIILPELNLATCSVPTICTDCEQTLQESYNYKSSCLEIEERLQDYKESGLRNFINLEDVVVRNGFTGKFNSFQVVCRTCIKIYSKDICTELDYEGVGDPLKDMLDKCLPEVNFSISKNPVICQICLEVLENLFNFIMQCLDSEEKINYYCERNSTQGVINLHKVYLFLQDMECTAVLNIQKSDTLSQGSDISECSIIDFTIKNNEANVQDIKPETKSIDLGALSQQSISNKINRFFTDQIVILDSDSEDVPEPLSQKNVVTDCKNEASDGNKITGEASSKKVEDDKKLVEQAAIIGGGEDESPLEAEDIIQLDELLQVKKVVKIIEKSTPKKGRRKPECSKDGPVQQEVKTETKTEKKDWKEPKSVYFEDEDDLKPVLKKNKRRYACPKCKRKFKIKGYLQYHVTKKCKGITSEEAQQEENFMSPPKPSEFKPRKCKWCSFFIDSLETLKSHLNIHRVHKCSNCPMLFVKRGSRNKHQLACILKVKTKIRRKVLPADTSESMVKKPKLMNKKEEVKPVEQGGTSNEPKTDKLGPRTVYGHKQSYIFDRLKLTMYKCKLCPYQTRKKMNLTRHSSIHGKSSELKFYKCIWCHFKTLKQEILNMHMRVHRLESTSVRKCFLCSFTTDNEDEFQSHMVEHKTDT